MNQYIGLKIISKDSDGLRKFAIIQAERSQAVETLMNLVKAGHVITLTDNRDNRCSLVSIKFNKGEFYRAGGGHGFSVSWTKTTEKDSTWFIKSLAVFNTGQDNDSVGTIK